MAEREDTFEPGAGPTGEHRGRATREATGRPDVMGGPEPPDREDSDVMGDGDPKTPRGDLMEPGGTGNPGAE